MRRRQFLRNSALAASYVGLSTAGHAAAQRTFTLENGNLAWHLTEGPTGVCASNFENRLSGRRYRVRTQSEFALVLSLGERLEIPWWNFQLTDAGSVHPERESGLASGFAKTGSPSGKWSPVNNLAGGQKGRVYTGYGWFRYELIIPQPTRGRDLTLVLGGYDEQDWNEHWIYLNGIEVGHRSVSGRWRTPGRYLIRSTDPAYSSIQFGSPNLIAVRTRGYDYHTPGVSEDILEQYVFRPYLFDQYIAVGDPERRVAHFELRSHVQQSPERLSLALEDPSNQLAVTAHYQLDGFVRRKWLEIQNRSSDSRLLLDVELDTFELDGQVAGGGHGKPVFINDEGFAAIEHPAGINQGGASEVRLWHCPGRTIAPQAILRTHSAIVAAAPANGSLEQFHSYLRSNSPRKTKGRVSIFTCFGTNNQWGACPTLNDSEVLDDQHVVGSWQKHGAKFDFFTLDTGWPSPDGDLTEFVNTCYPDGPAPMVDGIHRLGMKFGLWFSEGWGGWANGLYPPIQRSAIPEPGSSPKSSDAVPVGTFRNGYPIGGGTGRSMCMASQPYRRVFHDAIMHHVRENQARLLKFDSGTYYCNSTEHDHLPGKYSTEAMADRVIEIVQSARALAPEVFVMWYWGEGSPFWALHGDVISESGLFMEGSGTSQFPTLYYRDSVTLSLDQNTQFAKLLPATNKDSLGIWLSQIRWGNFMGKERWREALVMDLGRGSLVFPQLWGDPNLLSESDVEFLTKMMTLAGTNEKLLQRPRRSIGDTWKNDPYAYAFCEGTRGLIFCNNAHFTSRKLALPLDQSLGLTAKEGTPLSLTTHFPEKTTLGSAENQFRAGGVAEIWLRPFETLLVEVGAESSGPSRGEAADRTASRYGAQIELQPSQPTPWMDLKFADAERLEHDGLERSQQCFSSRLPELSGARDLLAITIKLTERGKPYRYTPFVAQIIQLRGRLAGRNIQMIPVPDARRFGNTQHAGCSWVLYKIPLSPKHSRETLEFAVHSYLPPGVTAHTEAWTVEQWWRLDGRPEADGFYGDSPS